MAQIDVIQKFVGSLDNTNLSGVKAVDSAISSATNSKFTTLAALSNQIVADLKFCIDSNTDNDAAEFFLKNYCGIDLDNEDTGAITGSDAGNSQIKNSKSVVSESGVSDTSFIDNSFSVNGVTFQVGSFTGKHFTPLNFTSLNNNQKTIWQSLYTWWAKNSLDLIEQSYALNFDNATCKTVHVGFITQNNNSLATASNLKSGAIASDLDLKINLKYYNATDKINSDGAATSGSNDLLDTSIARELTKSALAANVNNFHNLPAFISTGLANLTVGIDNNYATSILSLVKNTTNLKNALNAKTNQVAGYILLRYLAHQFGSSQTFSNAVDHFVNYTQDSNISTARGDDTVINRGANSTISTDAGNDYVRNLSANVSVNAGAGDDFINNTAANVTIFGDNGDDIINNSASFVMIDGGNSYDSIRNTAANVSIYGGEGKDTLNNSGTNVSLFGGDDADRILTQNKSTVNAGSGDDTINSAKGNNVFVFENQKGDNLITKIFNTDIIYLPDVIGGTAVLDTMRSDDGKDGIIKFGNTSIQIANTGNSSVKVKFSDNTTAWVSFPNFSVRNDIFTNKKANTVLSALSGDDTVYNYAARVKINGQAGNDYLVSANTSQVTLIGGDDNDTLDSNSTTSANLQGGNGDDSIIVGFKSTVIAGAGNDIIINDNYSNNAGKSLFQFTNSNDSNIVTGWHSTDTLFLTQVGANNRVEVKRTGTDLYLSFANTNITLADLNDDSIVAKLSNKKNVTLTAQTATAEADFYVNNTADKFVTLSGGVDTVYNWTHATVDGGNDNDKLYNYGAEAIILGGNGNDYILSQADSATLDGGAGDDTIALNANATKNLIKYDGGMDIVTGFTGDDTLKVNGDFTTLKSGKDLIVKTDDDYITLKNIGKANITGGNLRDDTLAKGLSYTDSANAFITTATNYTGTFDMGFYPKAKSFNAADSKAVTVVGNWNANTITGGKGNDSLKVFAGNNKLIGGAGKDTLTGGADNDNMTGGDGADTFIYTGGKDVITDYSAEDTIIVSGSYKQKISGNNIIYTIGKGTLTLQNAKGKNINIMTASALITEENNNFAELDNIIDTKSVGDIEFTSTRDTIQNIMAYAGDD